MLEPIVKSIEVPCDQEKAFRVFIEEMGSWWPLDRFTFSAMQGAPAKTVQVDARVGGAIVEIGADDTETHWGTIRQYDPFSSLAMDFHIPAPGYPSDGATFVEVDFTSVGPERTRVELRQSNWEALGDLAEQVHGGYGTGWTMIFEGAYAAACGGSR